MKRNIIVAGIVVSILVAGFAIYEKVIHTQSLRINALAIRRDPEKRVNKNKSTTGKFIDSQYYPIAYEIAPVDSISNDAKVALFGFDIKKTTLPDGSIEVDLRPSNPSYDWKKFIIKSGYKLYFTDTTDDDEENGMTDTDSGSNGDDFPILVDPQGMIAQGQNIP